MLKQEWGYEYLGHMRSPQQPIEVRTVAQLCLEAPAWPLPLKGLAAASLARRGYESICDHRGQRDTAAGQHDIIVP